MNYRLQKFVLTALLALWFAPTSALATDLTDVPMAVKNTVVPNVMFTLDDSGSMQFEVIPESNIVYLTFPRPGSSGSSGTALYGTVYYGYGTFDGTAKFDPANRYSRCYRNSSCNQIYYNPAKRYTPWSNSDGSLMANATPTAAWFNPHNPGEGTMNLTIDNTWTRHWVLDGGTDPSASLTFYPATYFVYTGPAPAPTTVGAANNIETNYTRIEIRSGTFTKAAGRTDCAGTTCTYTEEIQNFANWFSYYRSRVLTARAGVGRAFAKQGTAMRVGFGAINKGSTSIDSVSTATIVRGVRDFTGTGRTNFFSDLYGHTMPTSGTPLRRALDDVGQYFSRTGDEGPWGQFPGNSGGTQFACRQNYNILMTDGYWNGAQASTTAARANVDNTNGTLKTSTVLVVPPLPATPFYPTFTYVAGNPFSDAYSNTLADVAMYYWVNDLRTDAAMPLNNVPTNTKDPAFWQHMVTFTVGLGVYGTISKTTVDDAFTAINNATTAPAITWPSPCDGCTTTNVDDLAHAGLNARGNFFSAADPDTFATALTDALDDIIARTGSASAVAVANANVSAGDNAAYASSYNSGTWTGDLDAFALDLNTGIPSPTSLWTSGTAQAQLDARTPAVTDRYIATYSGSGYASAGLQFQSATATLGPNITTRLSSAQEARLNTPSASPVDGADVLAYLRGDRSGETGTYRFRSHLLGDIINSEPVVIRAPARHYIDNGYAAFRLAQASRVKMVVQGGNDGMVHVFNATTGAENWAYVPNLLIEMSDPANSGTSVLNMLSRKTYAHRLYVDGTPFAGDVDFCNTESAGCSAGATNWRTLLVGGLGKGGRGVYALDMTTPDVGSEIGAASKVLWEFPNAGTNATVKANIGYIFGRPLIVKTKAKGWVVLVASGYNNGTGADNSGGDGHGYLFVLNARTGELIKAIDTTVGSTTTPSGLAQISALVDDAEYNNTVSQVYGGDLLGNMWRFDLSDLSSTTNWKVKRLAILKDGSTVGALTQPVTTEPQLALTKINNVYKRVVYVGTGQYLGDSDVPISATETPGSRTQTMYGLVDDLSNPAADVLTPVISDNLRSSLQVQTFTPSATDPARTVTHNTVDYTTKKGWYLDLQDTGTAPSERVNTNPALVAGALIFTTNIPSSDACLPGGSSWLNVLDYQTGGALQLSATTWAPASHFLGNSLASRPVIIRLPNGDIMSLTRTSSGQTITSSTGIPIPAQASSRAAWREIPR